MNFEEYKNYWRKSSKNKPKQDIIERWETRVVNAGLQSKGEAGAESYLANYGKSIGSDKCVKLARHAEEMGYPYFATGIWKKAYLIDNPDGDVGLFSENQAQDKQGAILEQPTSSDTHPFDPFSHSFEPILAEPKREGKSYASTLGTVSDAFPFGMQPGNLVASQPTDAQMPREFYINDSRYWSMPKKDGNKMIVFATPEKVWYQSRQLKVNGAPSIEMDQAFKTVAGLLRPFILEGELYFVDVKGREHMTGETCRAANEMAGHPNALPVMQFSAFGCLYFGNNNLTRKQQQVWDAETIMDELIDVSPREFKKLPTAKTTIEKEDIARSQK